MNRKEAEALFDVAIRRCPFCGSGDLDVGIVSFSVRGVSCEYCGGNVARELPTYYDIDIMKVPAEEFTLRLAIMAWNREPF